MKLAEWLALGVVMLIGGGLSTPPAQAGYIVTLEQQGSNVVATGRGTLDLTDLSLVGGGFSRANMVPLAAQIDTGPASTTPIDIYTGFAGPTSFGTGPTILADSGSGDLVGITGPRRGGTGALVVPASYVSAGVLSDTSTYDNATFASLGVTPGQYVWTWGSGEDADTFTLQIGVAAVPESGTLMLLAAGLAGFALLRRHRQNPA